MTEAVVVIKKGIGVLERLRSYLDPGKRHALEEAVTDHVLSEIPRILHLLEQRIEQVHASGCTPEEASIITYQVIDAQKRTFDEEKRRRLSNVLVNGLCSSKWDRSMHRLLIRLTSELEEEHIALLHWYAAETKEERDRINAARGFPEPKLVQTPDGLRFTPEARAHFDLDDALERELIARGVLDEKQEASLRRGIPYDEHKGDIEDVEINWDRRISTVGRALLAYLADPESTSDAP